MFHNLGRGFWRSCRPEIRRCRRADSTVSRDIEACVRRGEKPSTTQGPSTPLRSGRDDNPYDQDMGGRASLGWADVAVRPPYFIPHLFCHEILGTNNQPLPYPCVVTKPGGHRLRLEGEEAQHMASAKAWYWIGLGVMVLSIGSSNMARCWLSRAAMTGDE